MNNLVDQSIVNKKEKHLFVLHVHFFCQLLVWKNLFAQEKILDAGPFAAKRLVVRPLSIVRNELLFDHGSEASY